MAEPLTAEQQRFVEEWDWLAKEIAKGQIREHRNFDAGDIESACGLGLVFAASGYTVELMKTGPEAYIRARIWGTLQDNVYRKDFFGDKRRRADGTTPGLVAQEEAPEAGDRSPVTDVTTIGAGQAKTAVGRVLGLGEVARRLPADARGVRPDRTQIRRTLMRHRCDGVFFSPDIGGRRGGQWIIAESALGEISRLMAEDRRRRPIAARERRRRTMAELLETTGVEMLTARQIAGALQLSPKTVVEMGKDGRLPAPVRVAGRLRWMRQGMADFIGNLSKAADKERKAATAKAEGAKTKA